MSIGELECSREAQSNSTESLEVQLQAEIERLHASNEQLNADLVPFKDLDLESLQTAFTNVYEGYSSEPEIQQICLQVAEDLGVERIGEIQIADHAVHIPPERRLLG